MLDDGHLAAGLLPAHAEADPMDPMLRSGACGGRSTVSGRALPYAVASASVLGRKTVMCCPLLTLE